MGGLRLGKIFGVRVGVDWSLFIAVWLVTVGLASGTFPAWHPDWSPALRWGVALAAALLFFGSVLLHELSHVLVGRAFGLHARSITLFLFGGVANIEREPETPRAEFLIAVIGPLVSVGLGFLCLLTGAWLAGGPADDPEAVMRGLGPVATVLFWLGPVNIVIGMFNLLPGFPLDGGRVLRAILWRATGDLERATRWATGAGQAIGLVLVFAGICMVFGVRLPLFGTGLVAGLWLAFLGWFLAGAAAASYQQSRLTALLEGVTVRRLMRRDVAVVSPELPLSRFVDEHLMRSDQRGFPVVLGGQLVGLVCLEDVRKVGREAWAEVRVGEIMTPAAVLEVTGPDAEVTEAMRALGRRDVEQLPVVHDGQLLGVLRRRDIIRWLELQAPTPSGRATPLPA
jgi:Zn-dependent protease/CBS domain-containing protein